MRKYEALIILVHQPIQERQKELIKKIDGIFAKSKVTIDARHDRGKKTLGHPMKKHHEGHICVYDIEADPSKIEGLVREMRLEDDLLQIMITHPTGVPAGKETEGVASGRKP